MGSPAAAEGPKVTGGRKAASTAAVISLAILSVRFIQGFIFWGGGSRRFIYAPSKLDPNAASWMANKFQTAMPGALLGFDHLVALMLHHFWIIYPAVILFSAAELIFGLFLIVGLFSRLSAAVTVGFAFVLMMLFGWQGATCVDEWTMAAANFGMGITLFLAGAGPYAIDNVLLRRNPSLAERSWFRWISGSLPPPISLRAFKRLALILFWVGVAFSVLTYNDYRGSVITPFHGGPVSPKAHHWKLTEGTLEPDGSVRFNAYVDAGTPAEVSNVITAKVLDANGAAVRQWTGTELAALPAAAIHNDFAYQKFHDGKYGLVGPVGAVATIRLAARQRAALPPGKYTLQLVSINNHVWSLPLTLSK